MYYRLYLLSVPEGRFVAFEEIDATDDVEAIHACEQRLGSHPLELWCGKRKVKSLPARKCSVADETSQLVSTRHPGEGQEV